MNPFDRLNRALLNANQKVLSVIVLVLIGGVCSFLLDSEAKTYFNTGCSRLLIKSGVSMSLRVCQKPFSSMLFVFWASFFCAIIGFCLFCIFSVVRRK